NERAEYAIVVRHDVTAMGLGVLLMRRIIDYARGRGIREIHGDVLRENKTMLKLCGVFGFSRAFVPDEPDIVKVVLNLSE
ncbi:MAG: GNAT family N-acetyltransferase, partial [Gammaproteobacteria bacterium]|nr:GNAT family N-acetyltransferase [Gammaproteobacteria bacterium]